MTEALSAIRRHEADILVGTQMIAKGHDFPNVTLVGVVNADTSLQMADFRAGESTVQLLMQVSGRAGRGEIPGRVVIQTYNPSHYTIQSVLNMSYDDFCSRELSSREVLQYPPYTRMLKILITSPDEKGTYEAAQKVAGVCRRLAEELRERKRFVAVMGPAPAPVMKLKDRFRWHIYVKAWTNSALQELMEAVVEETKELPLPRKTQLAVDRDPVSSF
jgi:primosomal protein N' (replication factor Y)